MLVPGTVLGKTEQGREAVQRRTLPMTPRQRAILISINGSLTVAELCRRFGAGPDDGQVMEILDQLVEKNLVEDQTPVEVAAPVVAGKNAIANAGVANLPDWRDLRQRAGELLHELMGPDADMLTLRLERAPTEQEFINQLTRAFDLVAGSHGEEAAERLRSELLQT